jgi:flagellar biogenesis protein FliO
MDYYTQFCAVFGVFALLGAALWALRRRGIAHVPFANPVRNSNMQLLGRLSLTPQHSIHAVQIGPRTLIVAAHPSGCTLLDQTQSAETGRQS